jgi:hypothetical protein
LEAAAVGADPLLEPDDDIFQLFQSKLTCSACLVA